jgi:hypothetical protein
MCKYQTSFNSISVVFVLADLQVPHRHQDHHL